MLKSSTSFKHVPFFHALHRQQYPLISIFYWTDLPADVGAQEEQNTSRRSAQKGGPRQAGSDIRGLLHQPWLH